VTPFRLENYRQLWIDTMASQETFFAEDDTRTRANIRIDTSGSQGSDDRLILVP
jgi:hypothetical protein